MLALFAQPNPLFAQPNPGRVILGIGVIFGCFNQFAQ